MFKKMLAAFFLMSSFCFAMSDDVVKNLSFCTEVENENRWDLSLEFLNHLVGTESIPHVDKIHYLQRMKVIYQISHDVLSYIECSKKIVELCEKYPDCNQECMSRYGAIY